MWLRSGSGQLQSFETSSGIACLWGDVVVFDAPALLDHRVCCEIPELTDIETDRCHETPQNVPSKLLFEEGWGEKADLRPTANSSREKRGPGLT